MKTSLFVLFIIALSGAVLLLLPGARAWTGVDEITELKPYNTSIKGLSMNTVYVGGRKVGCSALWSSSLRGISFIEKKVWIISFPVRDPEKYHRHVKYDVEVEYNNTKLHKITMMSSPETGSRFTLFLKPIEMAGIVSVSRVEITVGNEVNSYAMAEEKAAMPLVEKCAERQ